MMLIKSFLVIVLYCSSLNTVGQVKSIICGKVKSSDKFIIQVFEPIYGYNNLAFFDTSSINSSLVNGKDSLFKIVSLSKPAFITIYFTTIDKEFITRSDVLIFPGDSLHFDFDLSQNKPDAITYGGSNAMGQTLFNEINFQPFDKFIPVFDALAKLPGNNQMFTEQIKNVVRAVDMRFDSLQKKSLITKDFVEYIDLTFKCVFYNQVVTKLLRESAKSRLIDRNEKDIIIKRLFADMPPKDERLKGLYASEFYLDSYCDFLTYKKQNLAFTNELTSKKRNFHVNGRDYLIDENLVPFTYVENNQDQEDLWALRLLLFYNYPGKFDFSFIEQYDSIFSKNKWSSLLRRKFENTDLPKKIEYRLQSPIRFIDTTGITTINDLFSRLPGGQPVFIDIWATWCIPCIAAFGFNYQLDSFLIKNDIQRMYISLDANSNYEIWKQAVNKFALGGYHILANELLKNEIKQIIYKSKGNEGLPIPRYVLVQNGKVVINDAFSPTQFALLKRQITGVLKIE